MGVVPLQVPGLAESVCPTIAVPEIVGGVESDGIDTVVDEDVVVVGEHEVFREFE